MVLNSIKEMLKVCSFYLLQNAMIVDLINAKQDIMKIK